MGYGSLSATPIYTPKRHVPRIQSTPRRAHLIQISTNVTEVSPLITRGRVVSQRSSEGLLNWKIFGLVLILVIGIFIGVHLLVLEYKGLPTNYPFHLIDRSFQGYSMDTSNFTALNNSQVSNVVLFHTRSETCLNLSTCKHVISGMQNVPFNFLIGGDGKTYEGRGWNFKSGFDELPFNNESITVGMIGDFTFLEPPTNQVKEVEALISESIRRRKLLTSYKLHGARLHEIDGSKMFSKFNSMDQWVGWI